MTGIHADALCWFGATGDLGHKMTFPALYRMCKRGTLTVPVIAVAHSGWTLDDLQGRARESIDTYGGGVDDPAAFERANYQRTLHSWSTPGHLVPTARS